MSAYVLRLAGDEGAWYLSQHGSLTHYQANAMRFDSRKEADDMRSKFKSRFTIVRLVPKASKAKPWGADDGLVRRVGWKCAAMHDPSGRRGIWFRRVGDMLEVCGGREGEYTASFDFRDPETRDLYEVLDVSRWMISDHGTGMGAVVAPDCLYPYSEDDA